MSTDSKSNPESTAKPAKKARVRVLQNRLRIGNHFHAANTETVISTEEYELRRKDGEVELIALI